MFVCFAVRLSGAEKGSCDHWVKVMVKSFEIFFFFFCFTFLKEEV